MATPQPNDRGLPQFLITIDTEGDDLWSAPRRITTRNSEYLPRFQSLCESFGLRPTWLTNYEMAVCPRYREFANDVIRRGVGEIGMHLHAWNSPPLTPLTDDDFHHLPYLIEYPESVIVDKVEFLTDLLEDAFGVKMVSHRAGRWALNEAYARALVARGYSVDCSVTPLVSWKAQRGKPDGAGGTDYRAFPARAYWLDPIDISRPGEGPLLEVPMTILGPAGAGRLLHRTLGKGPKPLRAVANRLYPPIRWLRPKGGNLRTMLSILDDGVVSGADYVEFMLHSSEFMPGGSPTFRTPDSIERLYDDLAALFEAAGRRFRGATLAEYHARFAAARQQTASTAAARAGATAA